MPKTADDIVDALKKLSKAEMASLYDGMLAEAAIADLASFGEYVFGFRPAAHHMVWIDSLQNPDKHLAIIAPPGHAKTHWIMADAAFSIGCNPGIHIGYVSNTAMQAYKPSVAVKDIIEHNSSFHRIFPNVTPCKSKGWSEAEWFIDRPAVADKDATFVATGVCGPLLGSRMDRIYFDDICDKENMATRLLRRKLRDWVDEVADSRLTPSGRIISIMTRWHEEDIMAYWEAFGDKFEFIVMPALGYWEQLAGNILSDETEGTALWEAMWPKVKLLDIKRRSPARWERMYMGRPHSKQGNVFEASWWNFYKDAKDVGIQKIVASWDTGYKEEQWNDPTCCGVWGATDTNVYLLDLLLEHLKFPDLVKAVKRMDMKWKPRIHIIEDKSSGQSLLQSIRAETGIPAIGITPIGSKVERASAVSGMVEAGRVYLPEDSAWVPSFIEEHTKFPVGAHDDQVDQTVQFLAWYRDNEVMVDSVRHVYDIRQMYGPITPALDRLVGALG